MSQQFNRVCSLYVTRAASTGEGVYTPEESIDLSGLRIQFQTANQDEEGPSNCSIRVFNLDPQVVKKITRYGFSEVTLQAGYVGNVGTIFSGQIKQFRRGRLNATDTYLDILAADGELAYNYGMVSANLDAARNTPDGQRAVLNAAMSPLGVTVPPQDQTSALGGTGGTIPSPRGKVMFGMGRAYVNIRARTEGSTWSIQNGRLVIRPFNTYAPNDPVLVTAQTGLIGTPEATQSGINMKILLNPKIVCGQKIQMDNATINTTQFVGPDGSVSNNGIPFNQWGGTNSIQFLADTSFDGTYRAYVIEHTGDTRGQEWYTNLVCLLIDNTSQSVVGDSS